MPSRLRSGPMTNARGIVIYGIFFRIELKRMESGVRTCRSLCHAGRASGEQEARGGGGRGERPAPVGARRVRISRRAWPAISSDDHFHLFRPPPVGAELGAAADMQTASRTRRDKTSDEEERLIVVMMLNDRYNNYKL